MSFTMRIAIALMLVLLMSAGTVYGQCCELRGDIDHSGGEPDIADLVYLVSYMFSGGPEPPCIEEADIDGNGSDPDIADLVYLVTYMFQGGPAPEECPGSAMQFQSVSPTTGAPGTIITIYGVECPDPIEDLVVMFDTITIPAYSRTDTSIMFACPALPAGLYQISIDHPLASLLPVADYQMLEPEPTGLPPGEVAEELVAAISTINESVVISAEVLETNGMISAEELDSLQTTTLRLDGILIDAVGMINNLPDSQKVILDQVLAEAGLADLFGSAGLLKDLPSDTGQLRSYLDSRGEYAAFHGLILGDNISFGLSAVKPVLWAVNVAVALGTIGLSAPANAALATISFALNALDNLIEGFLPTDLYHVDLVVNPDNENTLSVGQSAPLEYRGHFQTQSGPVTASLSIFISGAFGFLDASAIDELIADIAAGIEIGAMEDILGNAQVLTLSEPVPIDISYYQLSGSEVVAYAGIALSDVLPGIQLLNALSFLGYTFPMLAITPLTINSSLVEVSEDLLTITALQEGVVGSSEIDMMAWVMNPLCESEGGWWWTWICLGVELPEWLGADDFSKPQIVIEGPCDCPPTVTDYDGNVYQTVLIGDQCWMMENLKVTHYRNGDPIPHVTDGGTWSGLTTGAYCAYDNDEGHVATYGRLYNWYAVDDIRNIAPEGWHVPTDDEWKQLEMYLGMSQAEADAMSWRGTDEGGKLKEAGTTHWSPPNDGATNESGFTALPGGYRFSDGSFGDMGYYALFWSSTEYFSSDAWLRGLGYGLSRVLRYDDSKHYGFSVRCVRD